MKKLLLLFIAAQFSLTSCTKKEKDTQNNGGNATQAKYFVKFTKNNNTQVEFRSDVLQTGHFSGGYNQVGGYLIDGPLLVGSRTLGFSIYNNNDSITVQEFLSFEGKTFYYDDTNYTVDLNYQDINPITETFDSYLPAKSDPKYKISISDIEKIGNSAPDKDLNGKYYDIYEVRGLCSGFLYSSDDTDSIEITNGEFFVRWTKAVH